MMMVVMSLDFSMPSGPFWSAYIAEAPKTTPSLSVLRVPSGCSD